MYIKKENSQNPVNNVYIKKEVDWQDPVNNTYIEKRDRQDVQDIYIEKMNG